VGGLKLLALPLSLVVSVLLARVLGPEGFGRYSFVISLLVVLALPISAGLRQLVTREVARYVEMREWRLLRGVLVRSHQVVLLGSLLLALVLGLLSLSRAAWAPDDTWTLILLGLVLVPLLGLNIVREATLRGLGSVVQAQIPELLARPLVQLVLAVVLLALGLLDPASAVAIYAASLLFSFTLGTVFLRRHLPTAVRGRRPSFRTGQWASAWLPFTMLGAATVVNNQLGLVLLGFLSSEEQVAAFRVAERGAQLALLSLTVANFVIGPRVTKLQLRGKRHKLQMLSRNTTLIALAAALPVALPLVLFAKPIVTLVFGPEYAVLAPCSATA